MLSEAIAQVSRALVYLLIDREGEEVEHAGSAVVVSRRGHALTAAHLLREATAVRGRGTSDKREHAAEVVEVDAEHDLALLRLAEPHGWEPVAPPPAEPVALGTAVAFMGVPHADIFEPPLVMTMRGIVGNRYRLGAATYDVIDAAAAEGMSGGPLFDTRSGRLLGIVSGRFDPAKTRARLRGTPLDEIARMPAERTNITFAIGSADVRALLARHDLLRPR